MVAVPDNFALYTVLAGVLLALLFAAIGAVQVVMRARGLAERLDGYADLPLFTTVELTQARLDIAADRIETFPQLGARLQRALAQVQAARGRVVAAGETARDAVRIAVIGE